MMPDPEVFSRCLRESFESLCAEVDAREAAQASMADHAPRRRVSDGKSAAGARAPVRKRPIKLAPVPPTILPEHKGQLQ